jgi:Uma2 family endonuclease
VRAFISTARLGDVPIEGHIPIRPDLAIEVVSAGDAKAMRLSGVLRKIRMTKLE